MAAATTTTTTTGTRTTTTGTRTTTTGTRTTTLSPYEGTLDALAGPYGLIELTLGDAWDPQVIGPTPSNVVLDTAELSARVRGHSVLTTTGANAGSLRLRWGVLLQTDAIAPYDIEAVDWAVELDGATHRLLATIGSEVAVYSVALDEGDVVLALDVADSRHTAAGAPVGFVLTPRAAGSHPWQGDWTIARTFIDGVGAFNPDIEFTPSCGRHRHTSLDGPYGILVGQWSIDSEGFVMGNESYRSWDASDCPGAPDNPDYQVEEPILGFFAVDEANDTVTLHAEVDAEMFSRTVRFVWEGTISEDATGIGIGVTSQSSDSSWRWWDEVDVQPAP